VNSQRRPWLALRLAPTGLIVFLAGTAVSDLGNGFFRLALPWLVYDMTHSAAAMGVLGAMQYVPQLLNPWAGALADRHGPRRTVIWASLLSAAVVLVIPLAGDAGMLSLPFVYAVTLLLAAGSMVLQAAVNVLVRRETPEAARMAVNSLVAMLFNVSWYGSPALAGLAIALWGVGAALVIDAVSFVGMLLPALLLADQAPVAGRLRVRLRRSLRVLVAAPGLWPVTGAFSVWNFAWGGVYALEVFFFRHTLHVGASIVGLIGLLAGTLPVALGIGGPWLLSRLRPPVLMFLTLATSGLGMAALGLTSAWPTATLAVTIMDGGVAPVLILQATIAQETIPGRIYGEVFALAWVPVLVALPAGSVAAGYIAAAWGASSAMAVMGAVSMAGAALSYFWLKDVTIGTSRPIRASGAP